MMEIRVVERVIQYLEDFPDRAIITGCKNLGWVPVVLVPNVLLEQQSSDAFIEIVPNILLTVSPTQQSQCL